MVKIPKLSRVILYTEPSSPSHASTLTKSTTKLGILHLSTAELPRITYSDNTSAS